MAGLSILSKFVSIKVTPDKDRFKRGINPRVAEIRHDA